MEGKSQLRATGSTVGECCVNVCKNGFMRVGVGLGFLNFMNFVSESEVQTSEETPGVVEGREPLC